MDPRRALTQSVSFTGQAVGGTPIPGSEYRLGARVFARDGIAYDIEGPRLRWTP